MRILLLVLLIQPFFISAQKVPDFGSVKADDLFNCDQPFNKDSSYYNVGKICNSTNYFELRLNSNYFHKGGNELIILSWNDNKWDIKKYSSRTGVFGRSVLTHSFENVVGIDAERSYITIFDSLKAYQVFLLPDQSELKDKMVVFDGPSYMVSYKIGQNFRRYRYSNPVTYSQNFPAIEEYIRLQQILILLKNCFN